MSSILSIVLLEEKYTILILKSGNKLKDYHRLKPEVMVLEIYRENIVKLND